MKSKQSKLHQYAFENKYLEEDNEELLNTLAVHVGHIVFQFNMLEERLTSFLSQMFIDDYDGIGLIVTEKMNYSSKVDLLNRLSLHYQEGINRDIVTHEKLIHDLKECGRLRNLAVHAEWATIDLDGFTFVKIRIKKGEIFQEFVQLNEKSLIKIRNRIIESYDLFDEYEELYNSNE